MLDIGPGTLPFKGNVGIVAHMKYKVQAKRHMKQTEALNGSILLPYTWYDTDNGSVQQSHASAEITGIVPSHIVNDLPLSIECYRKNTARKPRGITMRFQLALANRTHSPHRGMRYG